jgi:Kdo2-lipid IVA lauroyltransferase/acyltransferase
MTRRLRHLVEYGFIRLVRSMDHVLGRRVTEWLAAGLGRLAYRRFRIRADVVEAHLRQAFPERDEEWIRSTAEASYVHLGREGLAMLRMSRLDANEVVAAVVAPPSLDEVRAAIEAGSGVVMVAGHFGNWELAAAGLAARGIPVDAVVRSQSNPYFDGMINRARARLGVRVIRKGGGTRGALEALRKGHVIGLVADQDARGAGIFVPFFGRLASTHRGPALLALRSGAPLFLGMAIRRPDGSYEGRVQRIPVPEAGEFDDRVLALTAAYTSALEAVVREHPTQYFWHHRRWKTPPPVLERAPDTEVYTRTSDGPHPTDRS